MMRPGIEKKDLASHELIPLLAEIDGWTQCHFNDFLGQFCGVCPPKYEPMVCLPEYTESLDAIRKFEDDHIYSDHDTYVKFENILIDMVQEPLRATALERASAAAQTLSK